MGLSLLAFGLTFVVTSIEGAEAALLLAASAARAGWRRAITAVALGLVTLLPVGVGLYFLYQYVPHDLIEYGVAAIIFLLGARELKEGLEERTEYTEKGSSEKSESPSVTWPAYLGTILEGGEALLYTFVVAFSSLSWLPATVGGVIGFALPFVGLAALRRLAERIPAWKQEVGIGVVLMSAACILVILRVTGVLGG